MPAHVRIVLLCLGLMIATHVGAVRSSAQELPRELLEAVKASAVFMEVSKNQKVAGHGSGWIIEKDAKGVLVVTNRHVVLDDEDQKCDVTCYFHAGTDKEKKLPGTIIAVDPDEDLAVVRVDGEGLPEPRPTLKDASELHETMTVFTIGFPLSVAFKYGQRAPSVTIVATTISALRRLDNDLLARINLNGGVLPGNSGGMTVNAKGEVIGVVNAISAFSDNISYVIPIGQVHSLFNGKPDRVIGVPAASADPTKVIIDFYVNCFDPKGGITQLEFHHGPGSLIQGMTPDKIVLVSTPLAGMSPAIPMQYDKSRAQGHCRVVFNAADVSKGNTVFQVTTIRADGYKITTSPVALRVDTAKQFAFSPGYNESVEVVAAASGQGLTSDTKLIMMETPVDGMIVAGSGRYLLIRAGDEIAIVDLTRRERVKTLSVPKASLVAGGANYFVIFNSFTNKFEKWSLATMEKVQDFNPPKDLRPIKIAMGHSSDGPLFVYDIPKMIVNNGHARLSCAFLDLETFKGRIDVFYEGPVPRVQRGGDGFDAMTHAEIRAAGNGSCFTMWRPYTLPQGMAVFRNKRVKGGKLAIDSDESTGFYVVPSTDGETICTLRGALSSDLKRDKLTGPFLPCTDTDHILSLSEKGIELRSTSTGAVIKTFEAPLPIQFSQPDITKEDIFEFLFTLDQRIVCSPHYDMIAISFPGDKAVAISKIGLNLAPPNASPSASQKMVKVTTGTMRTWTDSTGTRTIRAKLLAVGADSIEVEMEAGGTRTVPFSRLSEADVKYAKAEAQKAASK